MLEKWWPIERSLQPQRMQIGRTQVGGHTELSVEKKVQRILDMFLIGWYELTEEEAARLRGALANVFVKDRSVER